MLNKLKYLSICLLFVILIIAGSTGSEFQRIISLSPNVTEILHLLELDDRVVAVTDHCHIESLRTARPSIGTFFSPNIEQIILLKPDLVIALTSQNNVTQRLKHALKNTTFLIVQDETTSDVLASVITIGKITNTEPRAIALVQEFQQKIARYRALTQRCGNRPRVLCVVGHTPGSLQQIYIAGRDTFLNELLEIVGAENVITVTSPRYPLITRETIITLNPDIIIDTAISDSATTEAIHLTMNAWQSLPLVKAVKEKKIYIIRDKFFTIPAPDSIIRSVELLYNLIWQKKE